METCHVLDFFVSITRDFSSQMGRENLRLHVHFLKVNNVWQKDTVAYTLLLKRRKCSLTKDQNMYYHALCFAFMLIIAVLILLRKILILFPDAAN